MDTHFFFIIKSIILLWIYIYGCWTILLELIGCTYLSLPLISILVSCALVFYCRLPAPDQCAVERVIGKDPALDPSTTNDNNEFVLRVFAHRGAGLDAPENSLIAFQMCAEKGCLGIELDAALTADDVPIVFHDDTLERLTDLDTPIRSMTWEELKSIDISVKHPLKEKFQRTYIAKLDEAIVQCLKSKQRIFIDIKGCDKKLTSEILNLYDRYPELQSNAICSSFFPSVIYTIRRKNPNIVCSLAWRPYFFGYDWYTACSGVTTPRTDSWYKQLILNGLDIIYSWIFPRLVYYVLGVSVVLIHKDSIDGKMIRDWREKGIRVVAWTVNHPVEKQHFSRILKITYLTDTLIGESMAHARVS